MRRLLAFGLLFAALPALAQEPRLVLRESVTVDRDVSVPDTSAMERVELDGQPLLLGRVLLGLGPGSVTLVEAALDPYSQTPFLQMTLSEADASAFAAVTEASVGRQVALVLDGRVLMAPTIQEAITGGRIQITGPFSMAEMEALAADVGEATGGEVRLPPPDAPSPKPKGPPGQ